MNDIRLSCDGGINFKISDRRFAGFPFWAWNGELDVSELKKQIDDLYNMGFGGFYIHSRAGMKVKYLGNHFMKLVEECIDYAKQKGMRVGIYDEDRWPSGVAGGYVTSDGKYCQKFLRFTSDRYEESENTVLLGCYDINLSETGYIHSYKCIPENTKAEYVKKYAYMITSSPEARYNNKAYVDVLNSEATERFINITYEEYKKKFGQHFGDIILTAFTDEPQYREVKQLPSAFSGCDGEIAWTDDFASGFYDENGIDILERIPEIFLNTEENDGYIRYLYYNYLSNLFVRSYTLPISEWCRKNNIDFTGHLRGESTFLEQSCFSGDVMRHYKYYDLPGVDIIYDNIEFTTLKQAQSVCHQYGKKGVMAELYGATNWNFDFRDYKFQGDWLAALGVTARVPHHSWVTMLSSAKRDYPATLGYHTPWYLEYKNLEDHYSRINLVLSGGNPVVNVAIINPIESFWMSYGLTDNNYDAIKSYDDKFRQLTECLLKNHIDADYICEALLPELASCEDGYVRVGRMNYKAIIVPPVKTLRSATLEFLRRFHKYGGEVVFVGTVPICADGIACGDISDFYNICTRITLDQASLMNVMDSYRIIDIRNLNGERCQNLIYTLRESDKEKWLFVAHGEKFSNRDSAEKQEICIRFSGEFKAELYDTVSGDIIPLEYSHTSGHTTIKTVVYANTSLLIRLSEHFDNSPAKNKVLPISSKKIIFMDKVDFVREEKNVCVLDMAEYSIDDSEFMPREEVLRIDNIVRKQLGLVLQKDKNVQPWYGVTNDKKCRVKLKFSFYSEYEAEAEYAFENAQCIELNGESVPMISSGHYVDVNIRKIKLPALKKGINELVVTMPLSEYETLENSFLIGDFDVRVQGCGYTITKPSKKIAFGSIANQGMPFYGGSISYIADFETPECDIKIVVDHFRGALVKVFVDDEELGNICWAPFEMSKQNIKAGIHKLKLVLYGNRYNTFGPLHYKFNDVKFCNPSFWYCEKEDWCYEYMLKNIGILSSPEIKIYERID